MHNERYGYKMKKTPASRARGLSAAAILFCAGMLILTVSLFINGALWSVHPGNLNLYKNGELTYAGDVYDRDGLVLVSTTDGKREYNSDASVRKATLHAIGDLGGYISTGIQTSFRAQLAGYDALNGLYTLDGHGNNIDLSINSALCVKAMNELGSRLGTVGIMNYKTGELLCVYSSPAYDPNNPPDFSKEADKYKGVYVNRLFSGFFAPGSIFKLVTACAAIDRLDGVFDKTWNCNRGFDVGDERLTCMGKHNDINFRDALKVSCNATFGQITLELGRDTMLDYTKQLGFGGKYKLDGISLEAGKYTLNGASDLDFAWSGIGQHNDLVNPLHYLMFVSAIANEGIAKSPHIIEGITTSYGLPQFAGQSTEKRYMSADTANTLKGMMRDTVIGNYGDNKFPNLSLCAKSGTAELDKQTEPHSLFTGFMDDPEHPLAFIVVAENSGSGSDIAARISNNVLQAAVSLGL